MKTINGQARDGDGNESFFLDLEADLGTNRHHLVQGNLHSESDGLTGGNNNGERLDSKSINSCRLS